MSRWIRSAPSGRAYSLLVAALLLFGQALLGVHPLRLAGVETNLFAGAPICHGGEADGSSAPRQTDPALDCALCVICHTLGSGALTPDPAGGDLGAVLPGPSAHAAVPPPARAPPARPVLAATYPTGPPRRA